MKASKGNDDWSALGFEEAVLTGFAFLCKAYGFTISSTTPIAVHYESADVVVRVDLEPMSFEISAVLERKQTGEQFTAWEVARLSGAPDVDERTFLQASNAERVHRLVPVLAETLRKYGGPALRGDAAFFSRLRDLQSRESEAFLLDGKLARVRELVQAAWRKQDYGRVVELLEPVREHLAKADTEKLAYARKKVGVR